MPDMSIQTVDFSFVGSQTGPLFLPRVSEITNQISGINKSPSSKLGLV
jgi:hypothetical protein